MAHNVEQHQAFEGGLDAWKTYLESIQSKKDVYTATRFRGHIDAFREALQKHLEDEIDTLLTLAQYPACDIEALAEEAHKDTLAKMTFAELRDNLPVLMLNHDSTYENGVHGMFPPMPYVLSFMLRRVAPCYNAGYWKYTTCNAMQLPKKLPHE